MGQPWERRDTESPEAFAAFIAYRDMGPDASLSGLARHLHRSKTLVAGWSREHQWQARVREWQAAQDRAATETRLAAIKDTERAKLDAVAAMNDLHARIAKNMVARVAQRINGMDVSKLSLRDTAYWLEVAVKIERIARGAPAAEIALTGHDGGAIEVTLQQQAAERISGLIGEVMAEGEARGLVGKLN